MIQGKWKAPNLKFGFLRFFKNDSRFLGFYIMDKYLI